MIFDSVLLHLCDNKFKWLSLKFLIGELSYMHFLLTLSFTSTSILLTNVLNIELQVTSNLNSSFAIN